MIFVQIFALVIVLLISLAVFSLSISFFFGAPFVTTPDKIIKEIIILAKIKSTDVVIDLGSGDGRILLKVAHYCKKAIGYEINPFLVLWSRIINTVKLPNNKIEINWKNYMDADLTNSTIVILYSIRSFVPSLETKLKNELKPGTKIISYKFELSKFKLIDSTKSRVYIYKQT